MLATPLSTPILQSLSEGSKRQADLHREVGRPSRSTLRLQLGRLGKLGVVEQCRRGGFPGALDYELTPAGRELLLVAEVVGHWLGDAPADPAPLGDRRAKATVKALVEGWTTTMLQALSTGALSLTELHRLIGVESLTYPSIERRFSALRLARLVIPQESDSRGTPYLPSDWLRAAVAPLAAAARWELRHGAVDAAPIAPIDAEALFLLALPLLRLPQELSGSCRLGMQITSKAAAGTAGAIVEIVDGNVVSCITELRGYANAWALGGVDAWLSALIEADPARLELGGDTRLARSIVEGLSRTLNAAPA